MIRFVLSAWLSLTIAVQVPVLAHASFAPPSEIDAQADALFEGGQFLAAAKVWEDALAAVPESLERRAERNGWVTGAVNAYKAAFDADPTHCAAIHASLRLADDYLETLVAVYGLPAKNADEYTAMRSHRDELDQARSQNGCPAAAGPLSPAAPTSTKPESLGPQPSEPSEPGEPSEDGSPPPPRLRNAGLVAGIGVSAALGVAMLATSLVLYSRLRRPNGELFQDILAAAKLNGVPNDREHDMCVEAKDLGATDVVDRCATWESREKVFITTSILAGVFGVSTAVFTGLLIRKRRQIHSVAARLREHHFQIGAMPRREGGAMFTGGLRF